jgi:hypothetical protein
MIKRCGAGLFPNGASGPRRLPIHWHLQRFVSQSNFNLRSFRQACIWHNDAISDVTRNGDGHGMALMKYPLEL